MSRCGKFGQRCSSSAWGYCLRGSHIHWEKWRQWRLRVRTSRCRAGPIDSARYTAAHCNTLQHTRQHCNILCNTHCNTQQPTATHCNTLQRRSVALGTTYGTRCTMEPGAVMNISRYLTATHYNTLQHILQHTALVTTLGPIHSLHNWCIRIHIYVYTYIGTTMESGAVMNLSR